jgi:hypothetical protein
MSQRLITVYDPSIMISEVEKRVKNTVKRGKVHSETIRTEKLIPYAHTIQIESKNGITHSMEFRRVHAAMIAKFGFQFPTLRRNANGTYTIAQTEKTAFVALLENGSRISGDDKVRLAKRAATIAVAQVSRVVEIVAVAA